MGSEIIGENGAVKIKHISQYAGVKVIGNDAGCDELVGMVSKAELMSGEANRFADYMLNLGKEDYDAASDLCLCVHQCMDEIKNKAKIIYS